LICRNFSPRRTPGSIDYLIKPFQKEALVAAINRALNQP
jgi:FixJ family two-component response regulator